MTTFRLREGDDIETLFPPLPYNGPLYLYLGEEAFVAPWVEGGQVPLFPARKYISLDRKGVMTPDELRQKIWSGPSEKDLRGVIGFDKFGTNVQIGSINIDGKDYGPLLIKNYHQEAYIICFSTKLSPKMMKRMGKTAAVKILNIAALKLVLDTALGQSSLSGCVDYTIRRTDRGHFMKSTEDKWQKEFRLVWTRPGSEPIWVGVPPGIAERVDPRMALS